MRTRTAAWSASSCAGARFTDASEADRSSGGGRPSTLTWSAPSAVICAAGTRAALSSREASRARMEANAVGRLADARNEHVHELRDGTYSRASRASALTGIAAGTLAWSVLAGTMARWYLPLNECDAAREKEAGMPLSLAHSLRTRKAGSHGSKRVASGRATPVRGRGRREIVQEIMRDRARDRAILCKRSCEIVREMVRDGARESAR